MPRIRVSGVMDVSSMQPADLDPGDRTGLTEAAFLRLSDEFSALDDLTFEYDPTDD